MVVETAVTREYKLQKTTKSLARGQTGGTKKRDAAATHEAGEVLKAKPP